MDSYLTIQIIVSKIYWITISFFILDFYNEYFILLGFQLAGQLATMSRAVLAVVSPSQMTSSQLLAVLTQLHSLSSHLVVVLLQVSLSHKI